MVNREDRVGSAILPLGSDRKQGQTITPMIIVALVIGLQGLRYLEREREAYSGQEVHSKVIMVTRKGKFAPMYGDGEHLILDDRDGAFELDSVSYDRHSHSETQSILSQRFKGEE